MFHFHGKSFKIEKYFYRTYVIFKNGSYSYICIVHSCKHFWPSGDDGECLIGTSCWHRHHQRCHCRISPRAIFDIFCLLFLKLQEERYGGRSMKCRISVYLLLIHAVATPKEPKAFAIGYALMCYNHLLTSFFFFFFVLFRCEQRISNPCGFFMYETFGTTVPTSAKKTITTAMAPDYNILLCIFLKISLHHRSSITNWAIHYIFILFIYSFLAENQTHYVRLLVFGISFNCSFSFRRTIKMVIFFFSRNITAIDVYFFRVTSQCED